MQLFTGGKRQTPARSDTPAVKTLDRPAEQTHTTAPEFNPFHSPTKTELPQAKTIDTQTPLLDELVENSESQIKLGLAHDHALDLLQRSVDILSAKLDDVKADKLPSVISAASKVVESIRKERLEVSKSGKDREVHYHFYTPEQRKMDSYEIIEVQ
jgi:hypothetical protein